MSLALDFNYARPDVQELLNNNVIGVLVYTGDARPNPTWLNLVHDAGIGIAFIFEMDETRAYGGYSYGVADAQSADRRANEVGYPLDSVIYYVAADTPNVVGHEFQISEYFRGIGDTSQRAQVGAYGGKAALAAARSGHHRVTMLWKVETWGDNEEYYNLMQMPNLSSPIPSTDVDNILTSDWGQWQKNKGDDDMVPDDLVQRLYKMTAQFSGDGVYIPESDSANARIALTWTAVSGLEDSLVAKLVAAYPATLTSDDVRKIVRQELNKTYVGVRQFHTQ